MTEIRSEAERCKQTIYYRRISRSYPLQNKTYTAVHIEQPNTFATFTYVAYDYSGGGWTQKDTKRLRVQIDGRTQDK